MKTALITVVFVLVAAGLPVLQGSDDSLVQPSEAPVESRSRFAALDDVRLLANGLLQLGQSLRDFVQKTKGQINYIFQKLNIFDRSFYQLSALTSEMKEEEEELKKTTVGLKASNDEIKGLSFEISSKVDSILQEKSHLQTKIESMEQKLTGLSKGMLTSEQAAEINSLRGVIQSQELSITDLLRSVREQSAQLNYQRTKIKNLEEKLTAHTLPQQTLERSPATSDGEAPTLAPYLPSVWMGGSATMNLPLDCSELFSSGERVSGVYAIRPNGSEPFNVFCDFSQDHGATVIQRRKDGSVSFDQTWQVYEKGFGNFQGEFWLGLRRIHSLAAPGDSFLRVQLEDWKQGRHFADYHVQLSGPESNYTINLKHLSGDLSDPLSNLTGMMFSTKDRDNDKSQDSSCAQIHTGGWWFNSCADAHLNGRYFHFRSVGRSVRRRGISLKVGRKSTHSFRFSQMSLLRFSTKPPESTETEQFFATSDVQ
ncbi:angiopoietin-related protein 3-like isoform 1-T1 [Synchiropus picturatus]